MLIKQFAEQSMKKTLLAIGCVAMLSAVIVVQGQTARQPGQSSSTSTADPVAAQRAVLNQYCITCHSEKAKSAGMDSARKLALDSLDLAKVSQDADTWEMVVRKLRAGMMPPVTSRRPDPSTMKGLITWLENELDRNAVPYMPPPGLHRLNRTEYANVVKDLLDLEIDPSKYLPSDDSTHGFDNIAGALGISSTLVEAYVSAAGKISRLAIGEPVTPSLVVYRTLEDTSQDYHIEGLPFGTRGGMLIEHVFPSDGEYNLTVTPIFGDNMSPTGFGSVPCEKLEILLDGERLRLLDWQGGGRTPTANCGGRGQTAEVRSGQAGPEAFGAGGGGGRGNTGGMRVRFPTTAGPHTIGVTFLQTNLAPILDLDKHFMRPTVQTGPTPGFTYFPHVGTVRIEGPYNAVQAKDSPSRRKVFTCRPTGAADETPCARRILTTLATRAYRRPASQQDVTGLMEFYQQGRKEGTFDDGIEMALARILAAPKFIYRIEAEPANLKDGQTYRISDLDLASRLSFFLWSTSPDEQLITVASQGRLKDPAVLEQQVRRMLKDPKAEALAVNFAGQWLNLRGLSAQAPLPMLYPDFDDPLRQSMRREVELLFDTIVREDRPITELLTADYTFVNERLAKHYGIKNIYGSQFRRVQLGKDMEARKGLTGKGAFLLTTSKPDRTSPVTRGKWIMTNILGMSPPDPPADVPPLKPKTADSTGNLKPQTMRQLMMEHRVRADCIQCHNLMDPIGFALENFDAIALWRPNEDGAAIESAATLFDGTKIDGPVGLRNWLGGYSDQFVQVVTEKLMVYALGRGIEHQDMPLIRAMSREVGRNGSKFSAAVMAVVKSKPFQMNMKVQQTSIQTNKEKGN
jgi:mono/diheme cytochrome c family protein